MERIDGDVDPIIQQKIQYSLPIAEVFMERLVLYLQALILQLIINQLCLLPGCFLLQMQEAVQIKVTICIS